MRRGRTELRVVEGNKTGKFQTSERAPDQNGFVREMRGRPRAQRALQRSSGDERVPVVSDDHGRVRGVRTFGEIAPAISFADLCGFPVADVKR
jgi:hypothetical protein